jgi:DNA-directed RNA polymerase specialized sigma24 family protein
MIRLLADDAAATILAGLPADQRSAISAHVLEGRDYGEIAGEERVGVPVIRKRVSRGLAALRARMGGPR